MFRSAQHDKGMLKRIAHAQLRSEQVEAWIRIRLSAVGQMLVERSDVHFTVIIYDVRNAGSGQNVERKILPLTARHFGMAVDPAGAYTAQNIWNDSREGVHKSVTAHQT